MTEIPQFDPTILAMSGTRIKVTFGETPECEYSTVTCEVILHITVMYVHFY